MLGIPQSDLSARARIGIFSSTELRSLWSCTVLSCCLNILAASSFLYAVYHVLHRFIGCNVILMSTCSVEIEIMSLSFTFSAQANARLVGLAERFAPCRPEFEPPWGRFVGQSSNPLGRICWPEEAQFICALKKNPLVYPTPNHRSKANSVSWELRCRCVWGERAEVRGFLNLREKVFFLSTMPEGCLTLRGSSFFFLLLSRLSISLMSYQKLHFVLHWQMRTWGALVVK
jgi:hypothetical protein